MRKKNQKIRCEKQRLPKVKGLCRTYDKVQTATAVYLSQREDIICIRCNVDSAVIDGKEYTTDFVCEMADGTLSVRECLYRRYITKPSNLKHESDKSLSMIDERIEEALKATGAKMLILDPIQAYLGGGMDMNRANEAREMTKRLGQLADKYECAIILIGHMNKAAGNKAAYRGMGSIDFFAVARSVLLVGRVEGEPSIRAVVQIKNNLAEFGHPKAFRLSNEGFEWMGDYDITVDEVLGGIAPKANKLEQAKRLLMELAETNNMMLSGEIIELASEEDISKRTMETAKKELNIKAKKINNAWYWLLDDLK